ncbi:DMT family transporter [Dongia rigui]|uniref:DMT family transporter n=1 Tax=Dongia rigui TaxID=940149 RepID=A0ABU5E4F9_9PROT|nr:DMT family transporter [Dongia rigui]MDY0874515.1 DMT family transporter [Dongia rigui]
MATSDGTGGEVAGAGPEVVGPPQGSAKPHSALSKRGPLPGITCLVVGAAVFSLQDVVIKLMSGGGYPLSEVLTVRGLVACVPLAFLLHFGGGGLTAVFSPRWKVLSFRAALLLVSYTTYYLAIANLPLAVAVALFFAAPLFIVLLSGPMLGEKVRGAQVAAVIVGFLGVLVICFGPSVMGGDGAAVDSLMKPASLLALASPLFYGLASVMARQLADSESGAVMASYQNLVFLAGAVVTALITNLGGDLSAGFEDKSLTFLLRPWVMPGMTDFLMIASTGLIGATGSFLLTQAYRLAEANIVTPFEYVSILFGTLFGWWLWNEVPSATTLGGIALIIGAGLYVLRGEKAH